MPHVPKYLAAGPLGQVDVKDDQIRDLRRLDTIGKIEIPDGLFPISNYSKFGIKPGAFNCPPDEEFVGFVILKDQDVGALRWDLFRSED